MNAILAITLPYGLGPGFDPMFDELESMRIDVYDTLTYFVYVLAFAGLLICAYRQQTGGDLSQMGNQLLMTAVVAVCLHFVTDWILDAEEVLGWALLDDMNIDMESITTEYIADVGIYIAAEVGIVIAALTAAIAAGTATFGAGAIVGCVYAIIAILCIIIVAIFAGFVWLMLPAAYIIQAVSIDIGIATSPVFLGMFLFPTTKETAIRYFTGLIAMMFWPLGWGLGYKLIEYINEQLAIAMLTVAPLISLNLLFAGMVDGLILIVEAMLFWAVIKKAPPLVAKALTTGTQIGAGLVSAGVAAAASTVSSSVSAAGSVASSAISMAGTVGGAAIGGAMSGGTGAGVGASVGGAMGGAAGSAVSGGANAAAAGIKGAGEGLAGMSEGA
jgi:hypothetical protein